MINKPIAWMSPDGKVSQTEGKLFHIPLYAAPKKRCDPICKPSVCDCIMTKPLSDGEIGLITTDKKWSHIESPLLLDFARAIEERHGIK